MKATTILLVACALILPGAAMSQTYPAKTVRMVVGFPPGGPTDVLARIVAQKLGEAWSQQVIVDNRAGASGMIGAELVARAAPDGYTLLMVPVTFAVTPSLFSRMNYDSERDFTAVAQVAAAPFILVVHPTLPVKTAKELVALARARPGQLNYASASTGGMPHLAGELFNLMAGVKMVHVPYKGAAPATTDLLAGQVQLMFNNMLSAMPQVKAGRLRAVAVTSARRSNALLELPAIAETLPGYEASGWYGLLAPAATPREAVARINAETGRIMKLPEVAQRLAGDGVEAVGTTPDQFAAYLRTEIAKWGRIVKTAGIKAD